MGERVSTRSDLFDLSKAKLFPLPKLMLLFLSRAFFVFDVSPFLCHDRLYVFFNCMFSFPVVNSP